MDKRIFKSLAKLIIGLLFILSIWWVVKCQCVNLRAFSPGAIRDYIQAFGRLAAVIYILAYALNTISILPPIAALSLAAGLAFGEFLGAIYLMSGAMLGISAAFFISRFFARGIIERLLKGKFKNLDSLLEKRGFVTILFFRVIPVIPYEVLNYASGLSKIKFKDYFFATFIGLIPGVIISAFFGGSLGGVRSFGGLFSGKFIAAFALLILIILVPILYKYFKKRRKDNHDA